MNFKSAFILACEMNKTFIATNFCVNKSNPTSCCKGKCFVNKSLKAQNDFERKLPIQLKVVDELVFFMESNVGFEQKIFLCNESQSTNPYFFKIYKSPFLEILQPPA
ncbi:MAG: hypothetical protein SFY32_15925 [Bacteroidota bacterium]|nr:hypothetical protein [Bacteroidota bacterium]